ncbi:MAG: SdpI family protein [Bacteroidia bacterium]|nr:SdpI family protein [Bacteroidia bacterium]
MKRKKIVQELVLIVLTLLPILYLTINWSALPESMPVHFDVHGNPNGYGSRMVYVFMPIGLYLLMLVLPKIDPRKANYVVFEGSYYRIRLIMAIFIGLIDSMVTWGVVSNTNAIHKFLPLTIFLLLMLIGNYMGNFRPNYFVGIKVPWTLNSDEVWVRTHKLAGKLWFWGSLAGMALYFVVPKPEWVFVPLMVILVVVPIVYSYVIYQKVEK